MAPAVSSPRFPDNTLASLLKDETIPLQTLIERHGVAATIAEKLLGAIPNAGMYYEIWPPANKMYYIVIPCFLNLPAYLFGFGAPKDLVSLSLYTSSLAAECTYCTAHACTFAIRRGIDKKKLGMQSLAERNGETSKLYSPAEKSVVDVAEKLARFPCKLTNADRKALLDNIKDPATVEAILLAATGVGYLNKGLDALAVPLEVEIYREVREVIGQSWTPGISGQFVDPKLHTAVDLAPGDSIWTYLSFLLSGPSAGNFERQAFAEIPENADDAFAFLVKKYGFEYPLLKSMHHVRAMRAITMMIHEGFNPETSVIGVKAKLMVAQIFSTITESVPSREATSAIAKHFEVDGQSLELAKELARDNDPIGAAMRLFPSEQDRELRAMLVVAHASSWSPVRINERIVTFCRESKIGSAALVEVVSVASVLQMLHRFSTFYRFDEE